MHGYCKEKLLVNHFWELKGLVVFLDILFIISNLHLMLKFVQVFVHRSVKTSSVTGVKLKENYELCNYISMFYYLQLYFKQSLLPNQMLSL